MTVKAWERYESVLAESLTQYISAKRALGCRFNTEERILRLLDKFVSLQSISNLQEITPIAIDGFMHSRPRSTNRSFNTLLSHVRCYFDWLICQDLISTSPVTLRARRETDRRLPYLFDAATVRRILGAAAKLPDVQRSPNRGRTYETIFALLATIGLRVGEATRLQIGDVDLRSDAITVRNSKFGKTRIVPFGPKLSVRLRDYLALRTTQFGLSSAEAPFFTWNGKSPIATNSVRNAFRDHILPSLGLPRKAGARHPCVHGLRHSFAVSTLLRMYRAGEDPADKVNHLSTILGHSSLHSTAVYLTITSELFQAAASRFAVYANALTEEKRV
jgi:site-specific recombinase XerD